MKMWLRRLIVIFVSALLLCISQPFWLSIPLIFGSSVVVGQTNNARKVEAESLLQQGKQQRQQNQYEAALQSLKQAFVIAKKIKNRKLNYEIIPLLLSIERQNDSRYAEANLLLDQSVVMSNNSQFQAAIELNQQALKIYQEIKEPISEATALNNIGINHVFLGNYNRGIGYIEQSLALAQKNSDPLIESQALGNLGIAYRRKGDYPKAIDYLQQQLVIAREIEDRFSELKVLVNLGNVYQDQEDYKQAISHHKQALEIAQQMHKPLEAAMAIGNIGNSYRMIGIYGKAIELIQQSLAIAEKVNNPYGQQLELSSLGEIYLSFAEYSKAKEYYLKSLEIAKSIGDREAEAKVLGNIGYVYDSQGDHKTAISYHEQHLKITRKIGNPASERQALSDLGNSYFALTEFRKALDYHEQAFKIARAMQVSGSSEIMNLGNIYNALGDSTKAIEYLQQSVVIDRKKNSSVDLGKALHNLGIAFQAQGNLPAAEKTLTEAITIRESIRVNSGTDSNRVLIFDTLAHTYRILQEVLVAQNKTDAALEISEAGRARALVDLLAKSENYNQIQPKEDSLKIEQIKQIAKSQNATIVQYSDIDYRYKVEGQGKVNTQKSELYVWVIKPTGEIKFRPFDLKSILQKENTTLEELVENIRDSIGVRDRSIFARTNSTTQNTTAKRDQFAIKVFPSPDDDPSKDLQKLHDILIKPIADLLPTDPNERVIFIPHNELFLVPFPALKDAQGKYLIEKHTILTAPSIQVLQLTHKREEEVKLASVQNALVVGNPDMPSVARKIGEEAEPLSKLPGAKKEAEAIIPLLKENKLKTKLLTDKQATKAAVLELLPQAKIIHLATHGLFDNIQGLQSAIALAPSGKDNGLLTAEEILKLKPKLNADLVVLSACNTGRGRITGDGVIGLSRSLISAGTPSVIVSLWAVPDAPTAELMTEFYKNLLNKQKPLDKAQALRQAMLKFKDKPPSDWAAFTLIGESNQVTN